MFNLDKITAVVLPESVTEIGNYAFKGANGLTSVVISDNVKTIGAHAFYGCKNLTIYTEAEEIKGEWDKHWNSSFRPVVWNCVLSEDKSYVVSVTVKDGGVTNYQKIQVGAPEREGFVFLGWATNASAQNPEYSAAEIIDVIDNTTLYAVWAPVNVR